MKTEAVLFDLGGTLVRLYDPSIVLQKTLESIGISSDLDQSLAIYEKVEKEMESSWLIRSKTHYSIEFYLRVLEEFGVIGMRNYLARYIQKIWWNQLELEVYPDAFKTLHELKRKKVKVGIISNVFEKDFRTPLAKTGLLNFVDIIVGIDTCGYAKPDKRMFEYAVKKLGLNRKQALFVGDSIECDYNGAKEAGLEALLISRKTRMPRNIHSISSLETVLAFI